MFVREKLYGVAMEVGAQNSPRTVEEVFRDFKGRRVGLIKALTTGVFFSFVLFCVSIFSFLFCLIGYFKLTLDFFVFLEI